MVALRCDAAPKADLCASCSEKPMPDDREADEADLAARIPKKVYKMKNETQLRGLSWTGLVLFFGIPTILNLIAFKLAIPYLTNNTDLPIEASYFLSVGGIVLAPMFFGAIFLAGREIGSYKMVDILSRFRVKRLCRVDWLWTIVGFVGLCVASILIVDYVMPIFNATSMPFFFQNMPLASDHMWLLYVWPVFFFFNIFGEEFLWRGYIQPRQELLNKRWTWLVHGLFWASWHIPMGFDLIFASLPIFFVLPAIVQFRQNTTIAIVIHAVFGAMGFLFLAFGLIR